MKWSLPLLTLVVPALAIPTAPAHAQVADPAATITAPPLVPFLQQRVVEELAADGIVLSRLGVTLELEQVGDRLLISLVDSATGRTSASTKIDQVPADREAAVASVTQVVANLTQQLSGPRPPAEAAPPPVLTPVEPRGDRDEPNARDLLAAEYEYRQSAIGFGSELVIWSTDTYIGVSKRWTAHRGELGEPLTGTAFYEEIGRPDLVAAYQRRRKIMWGTGIAGLALSGVGMYLAVKGIPDHEYCSILDPDPVYNACEQRNRQAEDRADGYMTAGLATMVAATIPLTISFYYMFKPHPISEGEAKRLAAEHNRSLRARLGLPVAARLTPYASADGGGLAVVGSF